MPKSDSDVSCKKTLFWKCLCAGLSAMLVAQLGALCLAFSETKIPKFVLEKAGLFFAPTGTRLEIDAGTLAHLSRLKLHAIRFYKNSESAEPILEIKTTTARFSPKQILLGNFQESRIFAEGITLFCPATLSDSGKRERALTHGSLATHLRETFSGTAQAKLGETPIFLSAQNIESHVPAHLKIPKKESIASQKKATGTPKSEPDFYQTIAKVAQALTLANATQRKFGLDGKIALTGTLTGTFNDFSLDLCAHCETFSLPKEKLSLEKITLSQKLRGSVPAQIIVPSTPLRLHAKRVYFTAGKHGILSEWAIDAGEIDTAIEIPVLESNNFTLPQKIALRAENLRAENFLHGSFRLDAPAVEVFSADFSKLETLDARANATLLNSPARLKIDFNDRIGTQIFYSIEADTRRIFSTTPIDAIVPADAKKLDFVEKPTLFGKIKLAPNFDFLSADFELNSGAARWRMVEAEAIHAHGSITPEALNLRLAQVRGENFCSNARVETELNPKGKYRIQAFGTIENPEALDDYLGWFWWRIWRDIKRAPSPTAPRADIDVAGTWDPASRWERVYGAIAGENALGGGVLVDKVRLRVAEEPTFISAFDMGFERGENTVAGTLQWHYALEPSYHFRDFRFAFSGTMPPHDVFKIVAEGLPETFAGVLERETAGTANVRGFISGDKKFYPQERILVEVDVLEALGDFKILDISGRDFVGKINYDTGTVRVAPFFAKCDDGKVSGTISIDFPETMEATGTQIALDLKLENITRSRLFDTLAIFKNEKKPPATSENFLGKTPKTAKKHVPAADLSKINAHFLGKLTLPDIETLDATGTFEMEDPNLFDLQIFGNFSRLLNTLKFSLTSFNFTHAKTDYTFQNGNLYLPNLLIYGESGEINVQASVALEDESIRGHAVFRNRRGTDLPILGRIFDFASDSTKFTPIEISGTLENINWEIRPFKSTPKQNIGEVPKK